MGQGLRRASWSEGGGCGGAAGFSFGERPGSNGGSAGRWLLPFPGNGPGTGGVFLGRRGRAAAGRRASLSGRERVRTDALRGGGCCRSPETARVPAACFFVGGNRLRRGGEPLFRGEAGSDTFPVATAIRCYRPLLAFPLLAACLPAACHHLIIRCCLHPRRFSPAAPAASHPAACVPAACVPAACYLRHRCLPPLSLSASPLPVAFPACYHPPPAARYLRRCLRPRFCLPSRRFSPAAPAACHFRRHAPAGRTDGLRRHPAWSVGARCVAGEKFCEIIWKIGKSFLSLFRLSIGVLAFRGRDSCFLLDYHSYGKRDYLSDGGRVQEAQGRA